MGFITKLFKKKQIETEVKKTANSLHTVCTKLQRSIDEFEEFGHLDLYALDTVGAEFELAEIEKTLDYSKENTEKLLNEYRKYFVEGPVMQSRNLTFYVYDGSNKKKVEKFTEMDSSFSYIKARLDEGYSLYKKFANIVNFYKSKWNFEMPVYC